MPPSMSSVPKLLIKPCTLASCKLGLSIRPKQIWFALCKPNLIKFTFEMDSKWKRKRAKSTYQSKHVAAHYALNDTRRQGMAKLLLLEK